MEVLGTFYFLVLLALALVLLVCWIVLPIAVIGTKPLLRSLIDEQRRTNELLQRLGDARPAAATPTQRLVDPVPRVEPNPGAWEPKPRTPVVPPPLPRTL